MKVHVARATLATLSLWVLACSETSSSSGEPTAGGRAMDGSVSGGGATPLTESEASSEGEAPVETTADSSPSEPAPSEPPVSDTANAPAPIDSVSSGEPPPAPRVACKRGVAYGHHSEADLRALSKGVTWWYNWAFEPDSGVRDVFGSLDVEYVPMVWGGNADLGQVSDKVPASSTTLLGFNEPNFGSQSNLSAQAAAELWPELEQVADERGLKLVSPAVNFCGGDCQDTSPFDYLDDFFAACPGCRVDAIGVHIYVGCEGENGNHAQWLINHLHRYEERFTLPIWLTEFACDDATSDAEQQAFLVDAVSYLENDPRIERYAWFAGRADNVPHVDLLGADGELTALGEAYVHASSTGDCR